MRFTEFNFHPNLLEGIEASNYETATPVQEQVIPPIMEGRDVIASAQTGTGKTAAFLLPVMNNLLKNHVDGQVGALVIVPTRELAIQISQHMEGLSYFTHLSSIAIYGGNDAQNFVAEKKALQMGADIIVCTPGRMIAHLNMGYVNMKGLQFLYWMKRTGCSIWDSRMILIRSSKPCPGSVKIYCSPQPCRQK